MKTTQSPKLRAKDAIAQALIKILYVPTVFFDARWPKGRDKVDLLVIDRAGVGDVHVVQIAKDIDEAEKLLPKLLKIPAQFRWISFPHERVRGSIPHSKRIDKLPLFPEEGMGRIGVILVEPEEDDDSEGVAGDVVRRAERFPGSFYDEADQFIAKNKPDIQFR